MLLKLKFRSVARFLTIMNLSIFTPIRWTTDSTNLYAILTILSCVVLSGTYTAAEFHFRESFGNAPLISKFKVSPDLFFAVSSLIQYILVRYSKNILPIQEVFWVGFGGCVLLVPLILCYHFQYEEPEMEAHNKVANVKEGGMVKD